MAKRMNIIYQLTDLAIQKGELTVKGIFRVLRYVLVFVFLMMFVLCNGG